MLPDLIFTPMFRCEGGKFDVILTKCNTTDDTTHPLLYTANINTWYSCRLSAHTTVEQLMRHQDVVEAVLHDGVQPYYELELLKGRYVVRVYLDNVLGSKASGSLHLGKRELGHPVLQRFAHLLTKRLDTRLDWIGCVPWFNSAESVIGDQLQEAAAATT